MSTDTITATRTRGRPRVRSDDQTRRIIVEAARGVFARSGYAGASMDEVAAEAGVSKKTLYRLIPTKADLFQATITERIERFIVALDEDALTRMPLVPALERIMTEYGLLTLSDDVVAVQRLVIAESERFPELASGFHKDAVVTTQAILVRCLERQRDAGHVVLEDCLEAAGMLRGMMAMEPQRAMMLAGARALSGTEVVDRAKRCVRIFVRGCREAT